MAVSLYDATVAGWIQILGGVTGFLARGLENCRERGIDPQKMVEARLFEDMFPLRFQVVSTVTHSVGAIEAVRKGVFTPPPTPELDYAGLQQAVADAQATLEGVSAEEVNRFEGRDTIFQFRDRTIPFTAENFLLSFATPNFYFHAATAYDILRANGVPLGKRDFLGRLRIKTSP
jgi:hypothetical protein